MTVYVDDWRQRAKVGRHDTRWSHLTADTVDELHAFATRLGLRQSYFQPGLNKGHPTPRWHYDVTENKRVQAIRLGAVAETWRDMGRRLVRDRDALVEQSRLHVVPEFGPAEGRAS